jgi:hypothetical protein
MKPRNCSCLECGAPFVAKREHAQFCTAKCRSTFNNRRNVRGAEMYDLIMALRYERDDATKAGAWTKLTKLAAHYHAVDQRERNGRKSWGDWRGWIRDNAWLNAVVVAWGRKGNWSLSE